MSFHRQDLDECYFVLSFVVLTGFVPFLIYYHVAISFYNTTVIFDVKNLLNYLHFYK